MAYKSRSTRIQARKSTRKIYTTLVLIILILYVSFAWVLPNVIDAIGSIRNTLHPPKPTEKPITDTAILAPPVITIPYEATNTAHINVSGYANGAKVKIYVNDSLQDTTDVSLNGNFQSSNIRLSLGDNNIYGINVDDQNHESLPSKTITLSYNNQAPTLTIDQPTDGQTVSGDDQNNKVTVSGQTDPDNQVFINDSRVIIDSSGKFSTTYPLNNGDNNLVIKAVDQSANSTEVTRKVTFNSTGSPSPSPN